jgi:hypothetical protein
MSYNFRNTKERQKRQDKYSQQRWKSVKWGENNVHIVPRWIEKSPNPIKRRRTILITEEMIDEYIRRQVIKPMNDYPTVYEEAPAPTLAHEATHEAKPEATHEVSAPVVLPEVSVLAHEAKPEVVLELLVPIVLPEASALAHEAAPVVLPEVSVPNVENLPKVLTTISDQWLSATSTKNYFLNDKFLDWIKLYEHAFDAKYNGIVTKFKTEDPFLEYIMGMGNKFESRVVQYFKKHFQKDMYDCGGNYKNCREERKFHETLKAMEKGYPLIISGVLMDYASQTFGIADMIVKKSFLHKIIKNFKLKKDEYDDYVIIDAKYTTLGLTSDGIHILNDGLIPAYKSQLYIYTRALSSALGIEINEAYILARKYKYVRSENNMQTSYEYDSCFDMLGKIDYSGKDSKYIGETNVALDWVRRCRRNGRNWDPYVTEEIFPNMSNTYDGGYNTIKRKICEHLCDITLIWNCTATHRSEAFRQGVANYDEEDCTAELLGFKKDSERCKIINNIIKINKETCKDIFHINKNNVRKMINGIGASTVKFFIDFETINDVVVENFANFPRSASNFFSGDSVFLFQIGVGYLCPLTNSFEYKSFFINTINDESEKKICLEFSEFVKEVVTVEKNISGNQNIQPIFIHWNHTECSLWRKISEKHSLNINNNNIIQPSMFFDLMKVFEQGPITIKGVFGFKLKHIVNKLNEYGCINLAWGNGNDSVDSIVADGNDAMMILRKAYVSSPILDKSSKYIKAIEKYNEIDCKALFTLLNFVNEHT